MIRRILCFLVIAGVCGCDHDWKKTAAHNKAEFVRHHSCVKSRWFDGYDSFDSIENKVVHNAGVDKYQCGGVSIYVYDDEEQP